MIYHSAEPATTLWELWNSPWGSPGMDSRDHIMFGALGSWFYDTLAGISQLPNTYGYDQILMKPPQSIINNKLNDTSKL